MTTALATGKRGAAAAVAGRLPQRVLALSTRDPRRALEVARRGLAAGSGLGREERARLLRALGHALRAVGDYREARGAYVESRRMFRRLGLELEREVCALGLVDACMYLGREREALCAAAEARRVFIRHRDLGRLAKLETNVGNLHHRLDALESALEHYQRAARLFREVGSPVERASLDHNLANVLTHLGRRGDAERLYLGAHKVLAESGERVLAAQVSYGLACLRFLNGDYAAAIAELEEVRPTLGQLGARALLALADLDLAEVLLTLRLHPEALALARSAGRWFGARGVPIDRAKCDLFAGMALAHLGRTGEAARALAAADRVFRAQRHATGRAAVALACGQVAMLSGRMEEAARHALRARAVFAQAGFVLRGLAAGALAAEARLAAGRSEAAGSLARTLLRQPRHPGDAYSRARMARVEGAAAARMGDRPGALRCYQEALQEAGRAHSALFVDEWRLGFLAGEPGFLDESLGVLLARRPRPRPLEVWRWLARFRASWGDVRSAPRSRSPAVRQRVEELRAQLEGCYARLWRQQDSTARRLEPARARHLRRRALALEGRLRRLGGLALRHRPRRAWPSQPPQPLPEGEAHVTYFSAGGRVGALRLDASGLALIPDLGAVAEVERRLQLFIYQMEVLGSHLPPLRDHRELVEARAREHLAALGRLLLEPVLGQCDGLRSLRLAPYGHLFRVPFHALTWGGAALIERCAVSVAPGLEAGSRTGAERRRGACVLGYAGAGPSFIEQEAREVAAALSEGGVRVEARTGEDARAAIVTRAAPRVALLHLSGHAVYRAEHPEFSALRLSDGWLTARDLAALPLAGACVVLSACETGPRGVVAGDEMLGLVRGLLHGGAAAVVASLWRVDDRATLDLMCEMYGSWRATGRLGTALGEVQRRSIREGRQPYWWGPFCLIGDPETPWPGASEVRGGGVE